MMDQKQASQVTTGLVVVLVGLVLLAGQARVGLDFGRLWPLILVVLGIGRFLSVDKDGHRRNGGWLLFLGGLFLLHTFDVWSLRHSWPMFIVATGVSLMLDRPAAPPPPRADDPIARLQTGRFEP